MGQRRQRWVLRDVKMSAHAARLNPQCVGGSHVVAVTAERAIGQSAAVFVAKAARRIPLAPVVAARRGSPCCLPRGRGPSTEPNRTRATSDMKSEPRTDADMREPFLCV